MKIVEAIKRAILFLVITFLLNVYGWHGLSIVFAEPFSLFSPKTLCLNVIVLEKDGTEAVDNIKIDNDIAQANVIWRKAGIEFTFKTSGKRFVGESDPQNDLWNVTGDDLNDEMLQKFRTILNVTPDDLINYSNDCTNIYYVNNIWIRPATGNQIPKPAWGVTLDACNSGQNGDIGIAMARRQPANVDDIYGESPTPINEMPSDTLSHELGHLLICTPEHTDKTLNDPLNILHGGSLGDINRTNFTAEQICHARNYGKLQDVPWYGTVNALEINQIYHNQLVCNGNFQQYEFMVEPGKQYTISVTPTSGDADLYASKNSSVINGLLNVDGSLNWNCTDSSCSSSTNAGDGVAESISFNAPSSGAPYTSYFAVYGNTDVDYTVQVSSVAPDFFTLSGQVSDVDGFFNYNYANVYANESTGANLGNSIYSSDGNYKMALFPGTYNVYTYVTQSYQNGTFRFRTPLESVDMNADQILNIVIPPSQEYSISGWVTDSATEVGLSGITVRAYGLNGSNSNTITNADGFYNLLVHSGNHNVYFYPPAGSDYEFKRVFTVSAGATLNTTLDRIQQFTISGSLIPPSGFESTNTNGDMFDPYTWVYASEITGANQGGFLYGAQDTYELKVFPGTYRVYAMFMKTYPNGLTRVSTPYNNIEISNSNATHNIISNSYDLYSLNGRVTNTSNVNQPGVSIVANDSNRIIFGSATTDSKGKYNLLLPSGAYNLRITAPPATYPPYEIKKLIVPYNDIERNIRLSLEYSLLEQAMEQLSPNLTLALDVFDIIDQAATLSYDISAPSAQDLEIILNWGGSEMRVDLYDPDGNLYGQYQSTVPPIIIQVPSPMSGTWKADVTAIEVPYNNYPIAFVAGITQNQAPTADAGLNYSGTVDSVITFDASNSSDPDGQISLYEWDWNNDGVYDESTTTATIDHIWAAEYSGTVQLKITDNNGLSATTTTSVEVTAPVIVGDLDKDGDVDRNDLNIITKYRNLPASAWPECDIDGDGTITVNDIRKAMLLCTRSRCAVE